MVVLQSIQIAVHAAYEKHLPAQCLLAVQKAADTARGHAQAAEIFEYGKKAYGKGRYERSVELFAAALQEADGPYSKLAGDIQLWLGLSYQVRMHDHD